MTARIVWGSTLLEGFDAAGTPIIHHDSGLASIDGVVREIGPVAELRARYPKAEVVGTRDFAITPGFGEAETSAERKRIALAEAVMPHVRRFYEGYLDGRGDEPHYRPSGRF